MPYYIIDTNNTVFAIENKYPPAGAYPQFGVLYSDLSFDLEKSLAQAEIDAMSALSTKKSAVRTQLVTDLSALAGISVSQLNNTQIQTVIMAALFKPGMIDENGKIVAQVD